MNLILLCLLLMISLHKKNNETIFFMVLALIGFQSNIGPVKDQIFTSLVISILEEVLVKLLRVSFSRNDSSEVESLALVIQHGNQKGGNCKRKGKKSHCS